jgi:hypothetical protein
VGVVVSPVGAAIACDPGYGNFWHALRSRQEETWLYRIAGIDVHKKMLAVVVSDVEVDGEYQFERRLFGSNPAQLRSLADWLLEQEAEEVVMESTAQYWKPVWGALERYWKPIRRKQEGPGPKSGTLHLAQAQSNRAPQGRKKDFPDAERLVRRLVADELTLSFVPDVEQRLWRTVMRRKYQLTRNRVQLQNRLECLLEEAHIKLSSFVSNLLGASARRMLKALGRRGNRPRSFGRSAFTRNTRTVVRCTWRMYGAQPRLSAATEDDARGVAINRRADWPTRSGNGEPAQPAPGRSAEAGGSARSGRGLGAADHRRSGCRGSDLSFREESLIMGWRMPR